MNYAEKHIALIVTTQSHSTQITLVRMRSLCFSQYIWHA